MTKKVIKNKTKDTIIPTIPRPKNTAQENKREKPR